MVKSERKIKVEILALFFPVTGPNSAKYSNTVNLVAHEDSARQVKFSESLSLCHQKV